MVKLNLLLNFFLLSITAIRQKNCDQRIKKKLHFV